MNLFPAYLRRAGRTLLASVALCCATASCDDAIYDYEGDCTVTYRMTFRYDRNMKWADAFAHEVKSVHLYAFDKSGVLVWQKSESGPALGKEGYCMTLDLPAGDYRMLAWCGIEAEGSFAVAEAREGVTRIEDVECRLNRSHDSSGAFSDEKLSSLYHGMMDVSLPASDDAAEYTYTMGLTKDTNHVRVILQHLSGKPVNENDFTFRIEEENGLMDYDNSLLPDEMISYRAYNVSSGTAGLGIDDYPEVSGTGSRSASRAVTSVSVAIADLSIARMMKGRSTYLTIEAKDDGHTVARIPLTDYALLLKDGYGEEISDQEYLDRQDEFTLTFFLDDNRYWVASSIIINSWKVVLDNINFE